MSYPSGSEGLAALVGWWTRIHRTDQLSLLVAVWVIAATIGAILALLVAILILHFRHRSKLAREAKWRGEWMLQLLDPEGEGKALKIQAFQLFPFLEVWSRMQESLRGEFKETLSELARRAGVIEHCHRFAQRGGIRDRIIAATTLGHLREQGSWGILQAVAKDKDPFVSLAAVRALSRIDARRAIEVFLEDFIGRSDWPLPNVYGIMLEIGAEVLTEPLVVRLLRDEQTPALRALHFLGAIRNEAAMVVVQALLHRKQSWEQEVALLKAVHSPELGGFVRSRLTADAWQVVVAAVNALARIGERGDMSLLHPLLGHKEWWVRYRSAHTLVRLPGVKAIEIELLASRLDDPFARDMLRHALAARSMG